MKRKEAIDQLREIQEIANIEVAHRLADDILCRLLHSLGMQTQLRNIIKSASGTIANKQLV